MKGLPAFAALAVALALSSCDGGGGGETHNILPRLIAQVEQSDVFGDSEHYTIDRDDPVVVKRHDTLFVAYNATWTKGVEVAGGGNVVRRVVYALHDDTVSGPEIMEYYSTGVIPEQSFPVGQPSSGSIARYDSQYNFVGVVENLDGDVVRGGSGAAVAAGARSSTTCMVRILWDGDRPISHTVLYCWTTGDGGSGGSGGGGTPGGTPGGGEFGDPDEEMSWDLCVTNDLHGRVVEVMQPGNVPVWRMDARAGTSICNVNGIDRIKQSIVYIDVVTKLNNVVLRSVSKNSGIGFGAESVEANGFYSHSEQGGSATVHLQDATHRGEVGPYVGADTIAETYTTDQFRTW